MASRFNPPWLIDQRKGGNAPLICDADGRVICLVRAGDAELVALLSLAPEMLRDLAALVHVLCRYDPEYCARHRVTSPSPEELAEALSDAIALVNHARDQGIPLSLPFEVTL